MWEPQHDLASSGWRVIMPQFRGFDCTTPDDVHAETIDDYARDVADLIETLSLKPAVIGGLSMGGYVALALYRQAPDLFRGLVLADTRADADAPEARANRARLIGVVATNGVAAVADEMVPKLLGQTTMRTQPKVEAWLRTMIAANQPGAVQAALRAMAGREDSTPLLSVVTVPTLVIVGEEDTLTPPALSSTMASAIPGAHLARLPQAGHLASLEQPAAFNAALLGFLDRL